MIKKKIKLFGFEFNILEILILVGLLSFFFYVRTLNFKNLGDQLLALDPYVFYRYAKELRNGTFSFNDTLRYYPNGCDISKEKPLPYITIYLLSYVFSFKENPVLFAAQIYPAVISTVAVFFYFFIVLLLTRNKFLSYLALFIVSVIPSFIFRTASGFCDKDPLAMFTTFTALLFVLLFVKSKDTKDRMKYLLCTSIFIILSWLSWRGIRFTVAIVYFIILLDVLLKKKITKDDLKIYSISLLPNIIIFTPFGGGYKYNPLTYVKDIKLLIVDAPFFIALFSFILEDKIKKIVQKIDKIFYEKLRLKINTQIFITALLFFISAPFIIPLSIKATQSPALTHLFASTVAELQPPKPSNIISQLSPLIFYTFIISMLILTLYIDLFKKSSYYLLTPSFFIFLISFLFLNYNFLYYPFFFFIAVIIISVIRERKIDFANISLFLAAISLFLATRAIRLIFNATPFVLSTYFVGYSLIINKIKEKIKSKKFKVIPEVLFFLLFIFPIYNLTLEGISYASRLGPNVNNYWLHAFNWIKNNTNKTDAFIHWWDYGYWIQTISERPTVVDGGNFFIERNEDIAKYLFNGVNKSDWLYVLEKYGKPKYLFIVSDDIFKFYQIARIARNVGAYSIVFLVGRDKQMEKILNETYNESIKYVYRYKAFNYVFLDNIITIDNKVFTPGNTIISYIYLLVTENGSSFYFARVHDLKFGYEAMVPIDCVCFEKTGCLGNATQFPLCLIPINNGLIIFPSKFKDNLFTRLYLLDMDIEGFEKVYDSNNYFPNTSVSDIIFIQMTRRQNIKIYRINYEELEK